MCLHFHKTCVIFCFLFRAFSNLNCAKRCSAIFVTKLGETVLMQAMNEGGFFWRCFCAVSRHQQDSTSIYSSKLVFWCILLLQLTALRAVARWFVDQVLRDSLLVSFCNVLGLIPYPLWTATFHANPLRHCPLLGTRECSLKLIWNIYVNDPSVDTDSLKQGLKQTTCYFFVFFSPLGLVALCAREVSA